MKRDRIIEWFKRDDLIEIDGAFLLAECGIISTKKNDDDSALQSTRSINYSIPLDSVDDISESTGIENQYNTLQRFECSLCDSLVERIYQELELEDYSTAKQRYVWGGRGAWVLVDTTYNISIMIKVQWDGSTYAGNVSIPVAGMSHDRPRGIINVNVALFNSTVTL